MSIIYEKYKNYATHNPAIREAQKASTEGRKLASDDSAQRAVNVNQSQATAHPQARTTRAHDYEQ